MYSLPSDEAIMGLVYPVPHQQCRDEHQISSKNHEPTPPLALPFNSECANDGNATSHQLAVVGT